MEYRRLGKNGPMVSRFCFGSLVMGPLQVGLSIEQGAQLILEAMALGVNFIDTAEIYETYGYVREALRLAGNDKEETRATGRSLPSLYKTVSSFHPSVMHTLGKEWMRASVKLKEVPGKTQLISSCFMSKNQS